MLRVVSPTSVASWGCWECSLQLHDILHPLTGRTIRRRESMGEKAKSKHDICVLDWHWLGLFSFRDLHKRLVSILTHFSYTLL